MNRHFFLKNPLTRNGSFNRSRNIQPKEEETPKPKEIGLFRIRNLKRDYTEFSYAKVNREKRRSLKMPEHFDLIKIKFLGTFNYDLKKKFLDYGLLAVEYLDFNKTVLFEVDNTEKFQEFIKDMEFVVNSKTALPYSGKRYNLISLIYRFSFIDKRLYTPHNDGVIISLIDSSTNQAIKQKELLISFFKKNKLEYTVNNTETSIYVNSTDQRILELIESNFDIVKAIVSSRGVLIRPGVFGILRMDYGFNTQIPENLPIVGIIDTGVNEIAPFEGLVLETKNLTNETDNDLSGHGTMVAGLAIFGEEFFDKTKTEYTAKCRVLPIKVIHRENDSFNFIQLINAIKEAHLNHGVRLFNMSLVQDHYKKYNEAFSEFAYELDVLARELDILVFISVGNFDADSLKGVLEENTGECDYPDFFTAETNYHSGEDTNIASPSESLNNLSIGALAGNLETAESSDITPLSDYPAYYTRKFHYDYESEINSQTLPPKHKNKHLNKPDLVYEGGDLFTKESGMEVLRTPSDYYARTAGTSLSTPLIISKAAETLTSYDDLSCQSIKSLLINSANYEKAGNLEHFECKESLLKKLTGFGRPDSSLLFASSDNSITLIIEEEIKSKEIMKIPIYLPEYLIKSGNKLEFTISLNYSFYPEKDNHLNYLSTHLSFNLVKNLPIKDIAEKNAEETAVKNSFSWSEDHFGLPNLMFSNAQKKIYRLQPSDIEKLNGEIALAVRCITKPEFENIESYPFSVVIRIEELIKNETEFNLYSEIQGINNLENISELDQEINIELG